MTWRDQNREIHVFFPSDYDNEDTREVYDAPYTLTLVAVENQVNSLADLTTTLHVMVDDIINGTEFSCLTFGDNDQLVVYKESKTLFLPQGMNVMVYN